jgi:hypothetical protein
MAEMRLSGILASNRDPRSYQGPMGPPGNLDIEDLKKYTDTQIQKEMEKTTNPVYKVFNIKDLLAELQFEGRGKGSKTETYLEGVITKINSTGKYRWVQFFQLVDVFFVVVEVGKYSIQRNTEEEIEAHYHPESAPVIPVANPAESKKAFENTKEKTAEVIKEKENYAQKTLSKPNLPWKK